MSIRRGLLMGMANGNNVRIQQGTFVGNGTNYQTIECPFEPDIILVDCPAAKASNIGVGVIGYVAVKEFILSSFDWASATATAPSTAAGNAYYSADWQSLWDYNNGQMRFARATGYARYKFIADATYNYTFIKYTT